MIRDSAAAIVDSITDFRTWVSFPASPSMLHRWLATSLAEVISDGKMPTELLALLAELHKARGQLWSREDFAARVEPLLDGATASALNVLNPDLEEVRV